MGVLYNNKYKSEYCQKLISHMKEGFSFESFGAQCQVGRQTLYDWVARHEEFAHAKAIAELLCLQHWEKEGKAGIREKDFKPQMWIFNMKARFAKFGWRDIPEDEVKDMQDKLELGNRLLAQLTKIGQDPRCQPLNLENSPQSESQPSSQSGLLGGSSKEK